MKRDAIATLIVKLIEAFVLRRTHNGIPCLSALMGAPVIWARPASEMLLPDGVNARRNSLEANYRSSYYVGDVYKTSGGG